MPNPTTPNSYAHSSPASMSGFIPGAIEADRVHDTPGPASPPEASDVGEAPPLIAVDSWVRESPPWLLSAVLHMIVLILFGLWLTGFSIEEPLALEATYAEELGEQLIEEELVLDATPDVDVEQQTLAIDPLPPVVDPLATPDFAELSPVGPVMASDRPSLAIGVALSGREPGMRQALLDSFGGTATTEAAVLAGLDWLCRNQNKKGHWSLRGPYEDGSRVENEEAATAMALLAFQGRGFTHKGDARDKYTDAVRRGWRRLLRSQDSDGNFFRQGPEHHRLYTQAQCAIALCELFGMTRDEAYREAAQRSIDYLVDIQAREGGWRYTPGSGSDLSVTGWVVIALQSARMAGLEVPSTTLDRVRGFLDLVARGEGSFRGSQYGYMARDGAKISMTAEGLLCRQYLGWGRDDPRLNEGVAVLLANLPRWQGRRNVYYWYYATQVCHHMEGEAWRQWNRVMRQMLPEHQVKRGRERGSWTPRGDRYGADAGRLYVTCLSIYTLEVYYRHLPIYRKGLLDGNL